jgi:dihydroxyacetone kinase
MNRVINSPDQVVEDMLMGWLAAHEGRVVATDNPRVVKRAAAPEPGKVGIVTGGGSGHEPAFLGYVGDGLVDAVAIGEIFSSPTAKSFADAMRGADSGAGVACLYGNYAGDNMNVRMAIETVAREGLTVKTVIANDDVPSAPKGEEGKRRGVAGEILMWKIGGAKAAMGGSLDEVIAVSRKAIDSTRSIGIGLSACVIPAVGKANFTIEHGKMEVGIGHHGEPGIDVRTTVTASEMAELMLGVVLPDLPFESADRVAVLISGLGATPLMEQYILYGEVARRLQARGITVAVNHVGNLFTSLEMFGITLTVMRLDEELEACLKFPCRSVGLTVGATVSGETAPVVVRQATRSGGEASRPVARPAAARRSVVGQAVALATAGGVVRDLIATINAHRGYLSEIDGAIGDGDHGINMSKGFTGCGQRLDAIGDQAQQLPTAFDQLSHALMDDIGGSMGPLYGQFFAALAQTLAPHEQLDAALFGEALADAVARVQSMGSAQVGDKTLIDTLVPALDGFRAAQAAGMPFALALEAMSEAAEAGKNSTKDMQARVGRSARLGPRSIGVLDAGATSCFLILQSMARSLRRQLGA